MFVSAFTIITSNIIYAIATLTAASKIHKYLLENSLRLPMFFFDITPIGRILGRFSTDMNGVDATLPSTFQNLITNTLKVSILCYNKFLVIRSFIQTSK